MDVQQLSLLVIEDNPLRSNDLRQALNRSSFSQHSFFAENPPEAIRYLEERNPRAGSPLPDLIMLNLSPQKEDNWELLTRLKQNSAWSTVPVLALSDSNDRTLIQQAYREGITSYFVQPSSPEEWVPLLESLRFYWGSVVRLPQKNVRWLTGPR